MITIDGIPIQKGERFQLELQGLSSDEKPTKEFKGMKIANGSNFFEIDTQNISFYDQVSETFVEG